MKYLVSIRESLVRRAKASMKTKAKNSLNNLDFLLPVIVKKRSKK